MRYYNGPVFKVTSTCKGGGYTYCRTEPPHPRQNAKGLYPLHRVLMENKLGRLLEPDELVHHRDEDKTNNTISNLEVKSRSAHSRDHARRADSIEVECGVCGKGISLKPHQLRLRQQRSADGLVKCSRSCGRKAGHLR